MTFHCEPPDYFLHEVRYCGTYYHKWIKASQITGISLVCSKAFSSQQQLHIWPFVRRIHWRSVDSPYKARVMRKAFSFHFIPWSMSMCQINHRGNRNTAINSEVTIRNMGKLKDINPWTTGDWHNAKWKSKNTRDHIFVLFLTRH